MDAFKPFQPLTTVRVGTAGGEIVQSREGWLDLGDAKSASMHVQVFSLTGMLFLETAPSEEGPFQVVESWDTATWTDCKDITLNLLTYYSAQNPLDRFLRWRFVESGAAGVASFQMRYQ